MQTLIDRLAKLLRLTLEETRRAMLLGLVLGGITASYTLAKTVRDASFLAELPATLLPYVYLGVGLLSILASSLLARATAHRAMWESLAVMVLFTALSFVAFAQIFRIEARWVSVAFYLWASVIGLILVSQFWLFANGLSHTREAKRIFGLVGTGGIVGGLIGGLVVTPLARLWTLPSLLNVAAFLLILTVPFICRRSSRTVAPALPEGDSEEGLVNPLSHPYVRWVALATLCSVMVAAIVDYQFKVEIQNRDPSPASLAAVLGLFYTATNLGAIALQVFATGWMIQRFGAASSAALLPVGLTLGAASIAAFPGFLTVIAARSWDQVARITVNRAATELFYFPISPGLRRRAKALIDGGLERVGEGIAGLLILVVAMAFGGTTRNLAVVVLLLVVVWVIAWSSVRQGYVAELGQNLHRLSLEPQQMRLSLREASLMKQMVGLLESRYERVVLLGVDMLEENVPEELDARLESLLSHRMPAVRARAVTLVRKREATSHAERLQALLEDDDPEVRVLALSAVTALKGDDPVGPLEEFLASDDLRLRVAAISALAEEATTTDEVRVQSAFARRLAEGGPRERVAVAEALGRRRAPSHLHDLLGPLLLDDDLLVRRAALKSAGVAQRRALVPTLLEALGVPNTEGAARAGLVALGDRVVGTLGDYLADPSVSMPMRHAIPRVLGEIHTQESANALLRCRDQRDMRLIYRVLKAMNQIRASGAPVVFPRGVIHQDIEEDVKAFLFALVHYRTCPIGDGPGAERLLCVVLNERMDQALNRVFRRLGLLYSPAEMMAAYEGAISDEARRRGNALEYLENALTPEHRALILPLVDDIGDEGRIALAQSRYGLRRISFGRTLEEILQHGDPWLKACALFVVGTRKERALLPLVESNLSTFDKLVRETAAWAQVAIAAS